MCDYSLELYASRRATTNEQYTLHRFPSGTHGFVSPADCTTAVCVLPGTRLQLENISDKTQEFLGVGPSEEVEMVHLDIIESAHHDAVRFQNGREALLQHLNAGVTCMLMPEVDLDKYRSAAAVGRREPVLA